MSFPVAIFGIIIISISLYLIIKGRRKLLYNLPILIVLLEIINVVLREIEYDSGINGLYFILLTLVVLSNIKPKFSKLAAYFYILILLLFGLLITNINNETSIFNNVSRVGNFILVLSIVPVYYSASLKMDNSLIYSNIVKSIYLYTGFIVISSLLKFGPNHYNTGIVYGFMFEQWYFGALVVTLFPVFVAKKYYPSIKKKYIDLIVIFILLLLILLVLRRTVWIMLLVGFLLYLGLSGMNKSNIKNLIISIVLISPLLFIILSSNVWDIRGDRNITSSLENIESEGRYIEYIMTYYTLEQNNDLLFGYKSAFDEIGKYNHPRIDRSMHGSYSRVFFGSGLIGLTIYLIYLISILSYLVRIRIRINNVQINLVLASFIVYLIVALTGASGIGLGSSYVVVLFIIVAIFLRNYRSVL